jgi:high-affinity iron transporter
MLSALLITLREGLEAALIVGIVLSVLRRLGKTDRGGWVWAGVGAAIAVSALAALVFGRLGLVLAGRGEAIYEGIAMLLAAGVLTWMIFWMQRESRQIKTSLEQRTRQALSGHSGQMLFGIAFVAVVREGLETALFLAAAALSATASQTLLGALAGLGIAVLLGWSLYATGHRLNLRAFFGVTSLLLILFAAGLLAHGVHELQEAALLPALVEHLYDVNPWLDEKGVVGSLLVALLGYNGNPSLLEALVYGGYLAVVAWATLPRGDGCCSLRLTADLSG